MPGERYENPLVTRYSSQAMAELWGDQRKFQKWRTMWIALAEAQSEMGLRVTPEQIAELREHADTIDFDVAQTYERQVRHDVMAHVHAYGDLCPKAKEIIHWGATSAFVTDNTDLLLLREALSLVRDELVAVIDRLAHFAADHRDMATLGFTHFQPAQPTTVGKRACLWAYDLVLDLGEIEHRLEKLKARGAKGTTGTQASFLQLFDGDHAKVLELESRVARKIGFSQTFAVTGQTYSRKIDDQVLATLSGVAASAHKSATDLRLLASRKEIEEPFESDQIGSSAMAYKRNPMRCERMCGLARFVMSLPANSATTHATQWFERTLDDSANRRLVLPQAFLATDAILQLYENVASGLVVYPEVVARNLHEELPFMATENILMAATAAGGDRQLLHERIRQHSQAAATVIKKTGGQNDLLARLADDEAFAQVDLNDACDPSRLVGRAPEQVDEFVHDVVGPIRAKYAQALGFSADLRV